MNRIATDLRSRAHHIVRRRLRGQLPGLAPQLMQYSQFWPHVGDQDGYSRPATLDRPIDNVGGRFPVPPRDLWASYCTSPESFLETGRQDVAQVAELLDQSGNPIGSAGRILDLGCAAGRMLRWIPELAPDAQLWGADIWSTAILWCHENLSPPAYFVTNTMTPHLPFEDRSLDLVYCGSVFTHVDDLAEAWFLEVHRIIRPGGRLVFSVNDRHSARLILDGGKPEYWERAGGRENWDSFAAQLRERDDFQRFMRSDAYMFTMGRSLVAHVMWDPDVLCERLAYGWRKHTVAHEAYGHQTVVLLERV